LGDEGEKRPCVIYNVGEGESDPFGLGRRILGPDKRTMRSLGLSPGGRHESVEQGGRGMVRFRSTECAEDGGQTSESKEEHATSTISFVEEGGGSRFHRGQGEMGESWGSAAGEKKKGEETNIRDNDRGEKPVRSRLRVWNLNKKKSSRRLEMAERAQSQGVGKEDETKIRNKLLEKFFD